MLLPASNESKSELSKNSSSCVDNSGTLVHIKTLRLNGFVLKYFPMVAHLLMSGEEFTISELMEVFSQGMTYSFLNRGMRIGAIERVGKGTFRLRFTPREMRITKDEVDGEVVLRRNGRTLEVIL